MTWELYCEETRPYWLMVTKGYGFSLHDIDWSCPSDLEPYSKAHALERKEKDMLVHAWFGSYGINSLCVALDKMLNGKKSTSEYIKEPIITKIEEENKPLTQDEIERQREIYVERLKVRKANFDLNHKDKGGKE